MKLTDIPYARRANRQLVALDQRAVDGERQERIGISDVVMVEEVLGVGMKMIHIDRPARNWNRQSELVFLIAFAVQRYKSQIIGLREFEQRTAQRGERRRLIVLSPEAAQYPIDFRQPHG